MVGMNGFEHLKATLYLEDGSEFIGHLFGAVKSTVGEIVFQTGMVGYVESLTDPSYAKQFLTLTYPLIGNYGVPDPAKKVSYHFRNFKNNFYDEFGLQDGFESSKIWPAALIVDRICPEGEHSHCEAIMSLSEWLRKSGVPGLAGIDVRLLTKKIREHGTMKAKLVVETDHKEDFDFVDIYRENIVAEVSRKEPQTFGKGDLKILAVDCGLKNNQVRCLARRECTVKVVPHNYPIDQEKDFDGLFLSNGPGDPAMCTETITRVGKILERPNSMPVFGICLGHQLLARAIGATTSKLKYGNRGHNQPCTHLDTGRCFITSQNHGFAVDPESLPQEWLPLFINENDKTNEGIVHTEKPYFSVQFHPEHTAGPTDMELLFDVFIDAVKKSKSGEKFNVHQMIKEKLAFETIYNIPEQRKVLVLGSGGLSIGQAGEFDYSGAQAIKALKEQKIRTVLINPNVATVQTSKGFADQTYFLPITKEYVTDVIKKERPTGILCTFGGQTGLNCAVDLYKDGILDQYNVTVLGTPIQAIMNTEDREKFKEEVESIGEKVAPSRAATTVEDAAAAAEELGYPVLVRAAFALGGLGSGFAANREELVKICKTALAHSNQVLVDKSLRGWKELEYEVVRDAYDNCITVCNMENVDPVGIHTGESVVIAPSQTLNDREYNALRQTAIKVIRHFGIIGECNIQYALNPESLEYYIIEVNARLSRSSALASKATGYPLAYIAAKLALGEKLPILRNSVTGKTTACFEPSLDYCVVKIPRWDLSKFARIGSSMKSVGEVMGIGRSFEEAFQKALRMVNEHYDGFSPFLFTRQTTDDDFANPTDKRMLALARSLFYQEHSVERLHELTQIDFWFLHRMNHIIDVYRKFEHVFTSNGTQPTRDLVLEAKQSGFSDAQIANISKKFGEIGSTEGAIRELRKSFNPPLMPFVKQIDTVAAEWPAVTNYLYLTYNGAEHDIEFNTADRKKSVIVLGSGVYRIGSSVEFDACCVGCVKELKTLGYKSIMINCNPETVSTDYDMCDKLYFEEISYEIVVDIYEMERPKGLILGFGGQAPNNIAMSLYRAKFPTDVIPEGYITIFGTSPEMIDHAEDRYKFSRALDELEIDQPRWKRADETEDAAKFCEQVGYPCLIRPSYVLSGAAMNVAHNEHDLENFLKQATHVSKSHPVVVSKFIEEAKEIDVDVVAMRMGPSRTSKVIAMAISEHVENAGIHSGDATLVTPPQDLNKKTLDGIRHIVEKIAAKLKVNGPFNMQLIAKNDKLYVIECNLRASRSFPFISKTLDFDFVALATRVMISVVDQKLKDSIKPVNVVFGRNNTLKKVGVKVPQFSFSRLAGADVIMGVEMVSTGEVGCFGKDRYDAYLKGLLSTGFVIPKKTVFLSIGGVAPKIEMEESVKLLADMGYELYGSKGTADYYQQKNIKIKAVDWPFEEGASDQGGPSSTEKTASAAKTVSDFLANKDFHLMINLPIRGSGAYRVSAYRTHGYKTRRMAIDNGIPLITDIKCAKLFVKALMFTREANLTRPQVNSQIDCISSYVLKRLPGFIDVHVHFREPGGEHKETWETGTRAAIAGGVTLVCAMPNTNPPLVDRKTYDTVEKLASRTAIADYALYAGATPQNVEETKAFAQKCAGLKMYLNETFATLKMPSVTDWIQHFKSFPENRPIVCHAEKQTLAAVLSVAQLTGRAVHIAHVSTEEEITMIREAKHKGWQVSCEVCPHHLFLTVDDLPEGWSEVRPRLGTKKDVEALWKNMEYIDCFATDHAPHTRDEKSNTNPPPGFPGVEYMLPLLLTAVAEGRLTIDQLVERLYKNPKKIFNLPEQPNTYIEVDLSEEWTIPQTGGESKAQWTPYAGKTVRGKVRTVVIRGEEVFVDGNFVAKPGFGKNIRLLAEKTRLSPEKEENGYKAQISMRNHLMQEMDQRRGSVQSMRNGETPRVSPTRTIMMKDKLWFKKSVIRIDHSTINKEMITQLFELANYIRADLDQDGVPRCVFKRHYVMASMFYEVSTRTKCSFGAAMKRLGGVVEDMDAQTSSVKKGETLEDSVIMMSGYADVILLRHPEVGAAERAKQVAKIPVINGGDGTGEHPTQALLDLFTIRDEIGHVNKITIALVGDLKHGRTVHSLAKILCNYEEITIRYVSSTKELGIPDEVFNYVDRHGVRFKQEKFYDLAEGIRQADVIYMTRLQKERFTNQEDYEAVRGKFKLTPKLLNQCRLDIEEHNVYNIQGMKKLPIVMHPLPRNEEISVEVDTDERAAYFRQAENGMYVRMALLALVLGVDFE